MLIASDRRCIVPVNGQFLVYDNMDKVFVINENVLLTVAGIFNDKELFIAPFVNGKDIQNIDDACEYIHEYLIGLQAIDEFISSRSYLLGGYDKEGKLAIINITYTESDDTIYIDKRTNIDSGLLIMYLPDVLIPEKESLEKTLVGLLKDNKDNIEKAVRLFLEIISDKSKLVGSNISCVYYY